MEQQFSLRRFYFGRRQDLQSRVRGEWDLPDQQAQKEEDENPSNAAKEREARIAQVAYQLRRLRSMARSHASSTALCITNAAAKLPQSVAPSTMASIFPTSA
jgi:hypothetical protein